MTPIESLRAEIEAVDTRLIAAIAERVSLAKRVGQVKQARGQPITDPAREAAVVARAAMLAREAGLPDDEIHALNWRLLAIARRVQLSTA